RTFIAQLLTGWRISYEARHQDFGNHGCCYALCGRGRPLYRLPVDHHGLADTHQSAEVKLLAQVDCAGPGQAVRDRGRDYAGGQEPVCDAPAEARGRGELLVDVQRVVVARNASEQHDV